MNIAYQSVQSGHAAIQFQYDYPTIATKWHQESKYLIYLSVENEDSLIRLMYKLQKSQINFSVFREPDLDNQITAIAIEPSDKTKRLISHLPLMLKEYNLFNEAEVCYE